MIKDSWEVIKRYKASLCIHYIISDGISIRYYNGQKLDVEKSLNVESSIKYLTKILSYNGYLVFNNDKETYKDILEYLQVKQRELNFKILNE